MGFKFLTENLPNRAREAFNRVLERRRLEQNNIFIQPETIEYNPLTTNNRPAVFINLNRNRDTFSDEEWSYLIKEQRRRLIEHMWSQGHIMHTIISQDENGLTLRTELLF